MKLCEAPSKIIGIVAGEIAINHIRVGESALKVRFALLSDNGPIGFMDLDEHGNQWSEKTLESLKVFVEALEEDGLRIIFKTSDPPTEASSSSTTEPAQF